MLLQVVIVVGAVILGFLIFWRLWFLRDPERAIPEGDNIVSPADGKIIKIIELDQKKLKIRKGLMGRVNTIVTDVSDAKYLISIFMTPFDVHIQRSPIDARIASVKYTKGRFHAANSTDALTNEKNEIVMEDLGNYMKVLQIAGFLARRIECFVKKGDRILKGERIGRINLGSQVSLVLPKNVKLKVAEGDTVKGGETIIGDWV